MVDQEINRCVIVGLLGLWVMVAHSILILLKKDSSLFVLTDEELADEVLNLKNALISNWDSWRLRIRWKQPCGLASRAMWMHQI